jgi:hypothetical protein
VAVVAGAGVTEGRQQRHPTRARTPLPTYNVVVQVAEAVLETDGSGGRVFQTHLEV